MITTDYTMITTVGKFLGELSQMFPGEYFWQDRHTGECYPIEELFDEIPQCAPEWATEIIANWTRPHLAVLTGIKPGAHSQHVVHKSRRDNE